MYFKVNFEEWDEILAVDYTRTAEVVLKSIIEHMRR